jgi:hypothetical protein
MIRKSCTNGNQQILGGGKIVQNPQNGVLLPQESYVFYQRAFKLPVLTPSDYQMNVDQPLIVPPGYILRIEDMMANCLPQEASATPSFMCLEAPASLGPPGQIYASTPVVFGFPIYGGPGNMIAWWYNGAGSGAIISPGIPVPVLMPDSYDYAASNEPVSYPCNYASQPKLDSGGYVAMRRVHTVMGGNAVWLTMFWFTQSDPILILFCVKGYLQLDVGQSDRSQLLA